MKQIKFIDGIMEIVDKLSSITAVVMNKIKRKKAIHISAEQEKGIEEVIDIISSQLEKLEKGIRGIGATDSKDNHNVTYLEGVDYSHPTQVEHVEMSQEQVGSEQPKKKQEYVSKEGQQQAFMKKTDKVIYIERIPSVVKIDKRRGVIHKKINGIPIEEVYQAENKGSIHPLHRFVNLRIKRGNVHQREPTWTRWKQM